MAMVCGHTGNSSARFGTLEESGCSQNAGLGLGPRLPTSLGLREMCLRIVAFFGDQGINLLAFFLQHLVDGYLFGSLMGAEDHQTGDR